MQINADSCMFIIQVGVFNLEANALAAQTKLSASTGMPVVIMLENGLYKVQITGFTGSETAEILLEKIIQQGFPDAYIHKNR
jgi:fructose-1-phosphate kinase PfkB-like protein